MSIKNIVRELNGFGSKSVGKLQRKMRAHGRARGSLIAPEAESCDKPSPDSVLGQSPWADLPPELLHDIIRRVEASDTAWPARRDVVACALVCTSWRRTTKRIVKTPEECGCLTFPISLKQAGPRDALIQCYIKRERATSTYRLFLGLSPALSGDRSKLLLAAKKIRKATGTDFRISFHGSDFCQKTSAYVGRLRSNFVGTKFTIYDSQPPNDVMQVNCKSQRNIRSVQVSPQVPARNYNVASVNYELNILRARGPRRMRCTMHSIPFSAIQEGGIAPTPMEFNSFRHEKMPPSFVSEVKQSVKEVRSGDLAEPGEPSFSRRDPLVLKNKAPRWHEQLQCWCLNFKGRVTVASVKNFQLVATVEPGQNVSAEEQEKVILQFGKIGKDIFTMDYRYPLSAFQAFAICLSSFDTKPACE